VPQEIDNLGPESSSPSSERDFDAWVRRRLTDWQTAQILAFEHWLLDEGHFEFVPAVHEAWRERSVEHDRAESSAPKRIVDELVFRLRGRVHVRALLEDRGASARELAEHTAEIERLRAQLADAVKASAA
jgi:hypothetical protein